MGVIKLGTALFRINVPTQPEIPKIIEYNVHALAFLLTTTTNRTSLFPVDPLLPQVGLSFKA